MAQRINWEIVVGKEIADMMKMLVSCVQKVSIVACYQDNLCHTIIIYIVPTETYFLFGLTILRNNSIITLSELHETNISNLACTTENAICCSEPQYDFAIGWEFPNGSYVSPSNQNITGVYLSTRNKSMILQVTAEASYTTGIYQCTIPGLNNLSNHLYIGILRDSSGMYKTSFRDQYITVLNA